MIRRSPCHCLPPDTGTTWVCDHGYWGRHPIRIGGRTISAWHKIDAPENT